MAQSPRTITVTLPDGTQSRPYPADMPPAQILALVETEMAQRENRPDPTTGMGRVEAGLSNTTQVRDMQRASDRGVAGHAMEDVSGALRLGSSLAGFIPGVGTPAALTKAGQVLNAGPKIMKTLNHIVSNAPRWAGEILPNVAASGIEGGDMSNEAAGQTALTAAGDALSNIPLKPIVKLAGSVAGPMTAAIKRGPGVYDKQADSIVRAYERTGLNPGGLSSNLEKELDKIFNKPGTGTANVRLRELDDLITSGQQSNFSPAESAMDAIQQYLRDKPRLVGRAVDASSEGVSGGSDFVADMLSRGQHLSVQEQEALKNLLKPSIAHDLGQGASSVGQRTYDDLNQLAGPDAQTLTDLLPTEVHPITSNMGQDIRSRLDQMGAGQRVPTTGSEALDSTIQRRLSEDLKGLDPDGTIGNLMAQYADLLELKKFNKSVRRDIASLPIRGGIGGMVGLGLGGPAGAAIGGPLAIPLLEPAAIFNILGAGPRRAGRMGPGTVRFTDYMTRMREPSEEY